MKRKILLLSVSILSVLCFQTGFTGLNNSDYSFPSVPASSTIPISTSLNQMNETETETELITEAETEASMETETEAETVVQTETETEVQTEVSTEAATLSEPETDVSASPEKKTKKVLYVPAPKITKQYLTTNEWSRPGKKIKKVKKLVIHYLGDPGGTAQEGRDYFESLKDSAGISISSNFIVGLDGEIIQCIPEKEAACATEKLDRTSLSIETCHMDSTGKYLKDTYISLVKLTAYLSEKYDVSTRNIVRHYDVTGDKCPRYFAKHSKAWKTFLEDVKLYRSLCRKKPKKAMKIQKYLAGLENTYSSKKDAKPEKKKKKKQTEEVAVSTASDNNYDQNNTDVAYSDSYDYYYEESYYDNGYYDYSDYDNTYYYDGYYDNTYYDNNYYNNGYYDNSYYDNSYYDNGYYDYSYSDPTSYDSGNYEDDGLLYGDYSTDTW